MRAAWEDDPEVIRLGHEHTRACLDGKLELARGIAARRLRRIIDLWHTENDPLADRA